MNSDLHFHFFVVVALIGLYQDWVPFALAILLVATHPFGIGLLAPELVFSGHAGHDAAALLGRALLHAGFVLAMAAAQVTSTGTSKRPYAGKRTAAGRAGRAERRPAAGGGRGGQAPGSGRRVRGRGPARPSRADGRTA